MITPIDVRTRPINPKEVIFSLFMTQFIGIEINGLAVRISEVNSAPAIRAASV